MFRFAVGADSQKLDTVGEDLVTTGLLRLITGQVGRHALDVVHPKFSVQRILIGLSF